MSPVLSIGMLILGALFAVVALAAFAFAKPAHWRQIRSNEPQPRAIVQRLRAVGAIGLIASLLCCLAVDHASIAALVFVMSLAAAGLLVAFLLAWRPLLLAAPLLLVRRARIRH